MNKVIVVGVIIALLVNIAVMLIGFSYLQDEINQLKLESDSPSMPTPTSAPTPTSSPEQTPAPTPQIETPANLVVNCTLKIVWGDMGTPRLKVLGSITNVGTETAYNVTIHVRTWFSNGTKAITIDHKLDRYNSPTLPPSPVNIEGNETYRAGTLVGMRSFEIPYDIWKDWEQGYVDNDCISTYRVTASWDIAS